MKGLGPVPRTEITPKAFLTAPWTAWFAQLWGLAVALGGNGATAARPTNNLYVGLMFFDTSLGIPVFVQSVGPTVWVNAAGVVV